MHARLAIVPLLALAAASCFGGSAAAACLSGDITAITVTGNSIGSYNPFTSFSPKLMTVSVSARQPCAVELAFSSPTSPARMSGPEVLAYDVQSTGGSSLLYGTGIPTNTAHIDIGAGNVGTATVQITVPAGQVVADGVYADNGLSAHVFDKTGSNFALLGYATVPVSGSVTKVCQFTTPASPTLSFSAAIANGMPNPGFVQSLTLGGVSCTAPTLVRLSGDAMRPVQPVAAPAGLDDRIHYRASASFNAASAVLDTRVASEAVSAARNTGTGATVNGSIGLNVNLLADKPLLAGSYAATLTVAVDPNP
jgi:spore coat protein U-like protein